MDVFALSTSSSSTQKLIPLGKSIPTMHSSLLPGKKKMNKINEKKKKTQQLK